MRLPAKAINKLAALAAACGALASPAAASPVLLLNTGVTTSGEDFTGCAGANDLGSVPNSGANPAVSQSMGTTAWYKATLAASTAWEVLLPATCSTLSVYTACSGSALATASNNSVLVFSRTGVIYIKIVAPTMNLTNVGMYDNNN